MVSDCGISNTTINAKIQYGNSAHVKFVLNPKEEEEEATTATKPLQINDMVTIDNL